MERAARKLPELEDFYVASLSSRSVVYKAMLTGAKLADFYPDLADPHFSAPFAVFHERFSTNTMPRWRLAQPFRMLAHNGEINTLQSNLTHMKIREAALSSPAIRTESGRSLKRTEATPQLWTTCWNCSRAEADPCPIP